MTYREIADCPVKCKWDNGTRKVDAMVVKGQDDKMFIIHNDEQYIGDDAGLIKHELGYKYSWSIGSRYSDNPSKEMDFACHNLTTISGSFNSLLQFKTIKRITL
jgi:hypothetical protein